MAAFDDDARRWARTALGMSPGDDVRFALLRKVKAAGFNVPADIGVAFRVVGQPAGNLGNVGRILESAGFGYERDQKRRQAVDAFAELYFSLPLVERGVRFQALVAECGGDPLLEGRLARLGRALEIDLDRDGLSPQEERVVSIVRELFPLPPDERATRQREVAREVGRDRPFDVKTLARLRTTWRDLAELDPELWRKLESAVEGWQPRRVQPVLERPPARAPLLDPQPPQIQGVGLEHNLRWVIGIPMFIICALNMLSKLLSPTVGEVGRPNVPIPFEKQKENEVNDVLKGLRGTKLEFDKDNKRFRVVEDGTMTTK